MKKKIFSLSLVAILSIVGISSVYAAESWAYISPSKLTDTTTAINGKNQYGRFGLEVTKGSAKATLFESCNGNSFKNAHSIDIYTTTKKASFQDYWMSNSCKYYVGINGESGTEVGVAYLKDTTN
ncbi:hypothetical protein ACIFOE_20560 [Paenibacillus sp. NRS-1783]|uniref:Uncharacterized protein n=1 Tax=Paenibacillus terrae TaxID=159743 RepID=A0A4U2PRG4_9BACL|nr:hypothetical protein [Paenibacillus terrae]TKH41895.1 hypothetical protein C1I60_21540 [Paenibacillus terrae]